MKYKLLWANPQNPSLCPVFALLLHLCLSGALEHPDGPIYGQINPETLKMFAALSIKTELQRRCELTFFVDSDDNRVNFSTMQVETLSKRIFEAVGLDDCTDHSIRNAFATWGSRQDATLPDILEIGEWNGYNSTEWYRYFENGQRKRKQLRHGVDPLSFIFPWPKLGMNPLVLSLNIYEDWVAPVSFK